MSKIKSQPVKIPAGNGGAVAAIKREVRTHIEPEIVYGFENVDSESVAIPFLNIVQSLSPIYKDEDKDPAVRLGVIYDTVTKELYTRVKIVPVAYNRKFIEWKPRESGGGFVAIHDELPGNVERIGSKNILPNGNTISDTRQHYVLYQEHSGLWNMALLSLKSTGIAVSKQWMTLMGRCREPLFDEQGVAIIDEETGEPAYRRQHSYERQYELYTRIERKNNNDYYVFCMRLLPEKTKGSALREAVSFSRLVQNKKVDIVDGYAHTSTDESIDDVAY